MRYTYDTYTAKQREKLDSLLDTGRKLYYQNTDDGVWYTVDGYVAHLVPRMEVLSARMDATRVPSIRFSGIYADCSRLGCFVRESTVGKHRSGRKLVRLSDGDRTTYIQQKYRRQFPSSAALYISGSRNPVLVCMETVNGFRPVGFIMPVRCWDEDFTPDD